MILPRTNRFRRLRVGPLSRSKRLKYHVGRGFYIPNMPELTDCEFASGNADTLILYAHR